MYIYLFNKKCRLVHSLYGIILVQTGYCSLFGTQGSCDLNYKLVALNYEATFLLRLPCCEVAVLTEGTIIVRGSISEVTLIVM